jgi:hypothetical protein
MPWPFGRVESEKTTAERAGVERRRVNRRGFMLEW